MKQKETKERYHVYRKSKSISEEYELPQGAY